MIQDYIDMDTQQKVRYVSESSNASTSGYSTMSTQVGNQSPVYSMPPSPTLSPARAALQAEFSQLNLPHTNLMNNPNFNALNTGSNHTFLLKEEPQSHTPTGYQMYQIQEVAYANYAEAPQNLYSLQQPNTQYVAELRILEHPVEKFRFRYKSEMHGTHGSLNGANSKRTPKTFPEVELCKFNGNAIIRCSVFQANLDSPHSHQLVVRRDDQDICDPHDLPVSPERGYVVQFQNMGIIHTAKKFIYEELHKKKLNRLLFSLGREELSTKEMQELHKQTEREAKEMNLNQVRLCFEAFQVTDDVWTPIAAAVFTNPINNRKSAQTGELRICRLSMVTGGVQGGEDLILLVEKVSKKNIKVRFYELNDDEEIVWEAFAKFREADVHHQYAIVCQTPPYRNNDIDKPVEVCIELVRPSDDERSYPPSTFRYKPREGIVSRKRRRTTSICTNNSTGNLSLSSAELPKTVQEQATHLMPAPSNLMPIMQPHMHGTQQQTLAVGNFFGKPPTISEEFNKDQELQKLICSDVFDALMTSNSEELSKYCPQNISDLCFELEPGSNYNQHAGSGRLETDGLSTCSNVTEKQNQKQLLADILHSDLYTKNMHLRKILHTYDALRLLSKVDEQKTKQAAHLVTQLYMEHAERNVLADSILHELVANNDAKIFVKLLHVLHYLQLQSLLNSQLNVHGESVLHCAIWHNRFYCIRPLLLLGCDPNIQDENGNTALHIAVAEQHQECVECLLEQKSGIKRCNLSARNDEGLTALHLAIRVNNQVLVQQLLLYDAKAASVCNTKDGNNALHMTVMQQNIPLIELLFDLCNPELWLQRNSAGQRALDLVKQLCSRVGSSLLPIFTKLSRRLNDTVTQSESLKEVAANYNQSNEKLYEFQHCTNFNLADLLKDVEKVNKLVKLLDEEEKWKSLAKKCHLKHLICLWSNAQDMLLYISSKAEAMDFEQFSIALSEVDSDALEVLKIK